MARFIIQVALHILAPGTVSRVAFKDRCQKAWLIDEKISCIDN
jgi:hypothetical protein